jgi:hypothetical protein
MPPLWLSQDRKEDPLAERLSDVGVRHVAPELRDPDVPVSGGRVVEGVEEPARRVVGSEGDGEEPGLARERDLRAQVEERSLEQLTAPDHADAAGLLDDEQAVVTRRRRDEQRALEPGDARECDGSGDADRRRLGGRRRRCGYRAPRDANEKSRASTRTVIRAPQLLAVVVRTEAARESPESVVERPELRAERVRDAAFEPAVRAGADPAEDGSALPRLPQRSVDAVEPPEGQRIGGVSAGDVDRVLPGEVVGRTLRRAEETQQLGSQSRRVKSSKNAAITRSASPPGVGTGTPAGGAPVTARGEIRRIAPRAPP